VRVSEGKEWIKKGTGLDLISSIVVGKHIATEWAGADIEAGIVVEVRTVAEPEQIFFLQTLFLHLSINQFL
jgi:hypothetical protein